MSNRTLTLDDSLYRYLLDNSLRETSLMRELRDETAQLELARMQIAPEQGQFMALLVELTGTRQIIEIGTFTGYSALCMAQALPEGGRIVCCDVDQEWTAIGRRYWQRAGVADRIDLRLAPAIETLDDLLASGSAGGFDMAFIDADKTGYADYYERCLQLVRPGGLMLFDNTLWGGRVAAPDDNDADTESLRQLNAWLHRDDRISMSLLPIGDGLTMAIRRSSEVG